ncbi:MAG: peroxiredoxin [Myxococcota bacterium]|jgi:peroxiredoxin
MGPHKWLLSVVLIFTGCDEQVENSTDSPERELSDSTATAPTEDTTPATGTFGPDNRWWHTDAAEIPPALAGTGYDIGDIAHDFTILDQHGDPVQLYQFYGQVIVLNVFVEWSYSCQDLTQLAQEMWEDLEDDGFVYLSVMVENTDATPPQVSDAAAWASTFGLTHPVLADTEASQDIYAQVAYPTLVIIDRDMTIVESDFWPMDPLWIAKYVLESGTSQE